MIHFELINLNILNQLPINVWDMFILLTPVCLQSIIMTKRVM